LFDFLSAADLPPGWQSMKKLCARRHNLGLLLRWTAALAEMRAYRAVPLSVRRAVIASFGDAVRSHLASAPGVTLLPAAPVDTAPAPGDAEPQETLPTVFSFALREWHEGRERALGVAALRQVACRLGAIDPRLHLGQPVALAPGAGDVPAVLRVAIGAPLLCGVALDTSLGITLPARMEWLAAQIGALARRLGAEVAGGRVRATDGRPS